MQKITIIILLLIFVGVPVTYANGNFAYNRLGTAVTIVSPLGDNGAIPVNIIDQTNVPLDIKVHEIINDNISLSQTPTIDTYDLVLNTGHGVSIGDLIEFQEEVDFPRLYFGEVLNVVGDTITMDTLVPWNFTTAGTIVFTFNNDLSVNGAVTEQVFTITNRLQTEFDITRILFHCTDNTAIDDSKFCGISKLTRGIVFRKKLLDGSYINYWNIKSNGEWGEIAFDKSYDDKAPAGFFGFTTRLTYSGNSKHGVIIQLLKGESIEVVVQDDLTGLETSGLMIEGHFE